MLPFNFKLLIKLLLFFFFFRDFELHHSYKKCAINRVYYYYYCLSLFRNRILDLAFLIVAALKQQKKNRSLSKNVQLKGNMNI